MVILRRICIAVVFVSVFLILGVSGLYLWVSDKSLTAKVTEVIESATDARISYRKDAKITRTLAPVLSVHDLIFEDKKKQITVHSTSLKIQINLIGLLFGKLEIPLLAMGDTRLEIKKTFEPTKPISQPSILLKPVLNDIHISQITVVNTKKEFSLSTLDLEDFKIQILPDTDQLQATLKTQIAGETFDITATIPKIQTTLKSENLPFDMHIKNSLSRLFVEGRIDFSSTPVTFEAGLKANLSDVPVPQSVQLDPIKDIDISAQISGNPKQMSIEVSELGLKTVKGLDLNLSGQLDLALNKTGVIPQNIDLSLIFSAPDTHAARALFFDGIPEFGAINGQASIISEKGHPSVEKIVIKARDRQGIHVDLSGRIESFPLDADISNTGYDLDVIMSSTRVSTMGERIGLYLPVEESLNIAYRIEGDSQALRFNKIDFSIGEKGRDQVRANGRIQFGRWDQPDPLESIDLTIDVNTKDTQTLGAVLKKTLPDLGPISARARILTESQNHQITDIHIQVGEKKLLTAEVTGFAEQITFFPKPSLDGIQLRANASGKKISDLADIFSIKTFIPPLVGFKASAQITGSSKKIGADKFSFVSVFDEKTEPEIQFEIKGHLKDFSRIETLSLDTQLTAVNLNGLGKLFEQEWPDLGPVKIDSHLKRKDDVVILKTETDVDDIQIQASNEIFFKKDPVYITGKIRANNFYFPKVIDIEEKYEAEKQKKNMSVFSREAINFDWIKKTNADFSVDIASFNKKKGANLSSASFKIGLESGRLNIKPGRLNYPQGNLEFEAQVDTQAENRISIRATGTDINPYQVLSIEDAQIKDTADADFDLDIDITSSGTNEHELVSNLGGNVYLIIKNGRIKGNFLHLLFVDLIGWTFTKTFGEDYVLIECGIMDYVIEQGVVHTNAFFLNGKNITIAGHGTVDLGQEQIDYMLLPSKKSRIVVTTEPVTVKGSLRNPSVTAIPWKSAASTAATYGSLIFSPYLFAGQVFAGYVKKLMNNQSVLSPCVEYEKKRKQINRQLPCD